jgi:Zn-dependent peptidase ImmA (M78 family)
MNGRTEEALERLSKQYSVTLPKLKVGLPKRHRKNILGCYIAKTQTICVFNSDTLKQPFVILHEFYHHLRTSVDKKHRGTEKHANEFAKEFLTACIP